MATQPPLVPSDPNAPKPTDPTPDSGGVPITPPKPPGHK